VKPKKSLKKRKPKSLSNPFTLPCGATIAWEHRFQEIVVVTINGHPLAGAFANTGPDWTGWGSHVELQFRRENIPALITLLKQVEKEHKAWTKENL